VSTLPPSGLQIVPDMPICQQDLPLDWYQPEFQPYAEEYLALPDRLPETVLPLLAQLRRALAPGGMLLVKDVDTRPTSKRWFTWALDKAMAPRTPVHYWSAETLAGALEASGFRVRRHLMVDVLPYPHVLYIAEAV